MMGFLDPSSKTVTIRPTAKRQVEPIAESLVRNFFMANKQIIKPAKSAPAVGPYNHAVRTGDLLFCAGQIPLDPATGDMVKGDIKVQTQRVLDNVKAILD